MVRFFERPRCRVAAVLAALALHAAPTAAGPSVNVGMIAAFPSPPYMTELLETAAQENATSYFPILDRIADGYFAAATTDRDQYERFLELLAEDGHLASGEALSTFKMALSLRSAAPRIEAHFQFYHTAVHGSVADGGLADGDEEAGCMPWILWEGAQHCSPALDAARGPVAAHETQERALPFDTSLGRGPVAVLYADITSPAFGPFHKALAAKARRGDLTYRLRHVRTAASAAGEPDALPVNGYGVELALKRTDYIVIDDRDADSGAEAATAKPAGDAAGADAAEVVLDDEDEAADLKALAKSELAELGLKAADYIARSSNPLDTLLKITQDFPKHASSLAAHNTSEAFVREHRANRMQVVQPGTNVLWMNGVQMVERQIQPLALVDAVRRERALIGGVRELGLTAKEAVALLSHEAVAAAKSESAPPPRFDWRDEREDGRVILWLNDLEKDARYADYPPSLQRLLQGSMTGQIPPVRRDIFNQVYAVDLAREEDVRLVIEQLLEFVRRRLPVRFGIVPLTAASAASARQAKAAYHLLQTYGLDAMIAYLQRSLQAGKTADADARLFQAVVQGRAPLDDGSDEEAASARPPLAFADVLADAGYDEQIALAQRWARRLGADTPVPHVFVDGLAVPRDDKWVSTMSAMLGTNLRLVQQGVYYGIIQDDDWVPNFFLRDALSRRNPYIFQNSDGRNLAVLDVNKLHTAHADLFGQVPVLEASLESTKETWAVLTAVLDLSTDDGVQLLFSALQFRVNNPGVRLDIVHNPGSSGSETSGPDFNAALNSLRASLTTIESWQELQTLLAAAAAAEPPAPTAYTAALERFRATAAVRPGTHVLILNGRVLGPIARTDAFQEDDFLAFLEFEQAARILPVFQAVEDLGLGSKVTSALAAAKLTSTTALSTLSDLPEGVFEAASMVRMAIFDTWNTTHTAFDVGATEADAATIHFTAVLNPASEQGQRWAPILAVLAQLEGVRVRVFLNPREHLDKLPVKRFYRAVLEAAPRFDAATGRVRALGAQFRGLPADALLNLGMDVPPAWLVAPAVSVHDLDNIKLSSVKAGADVDATYLLKHILIEGHSQERGGPAGVQPPRGAQLLLGTEQDEHVADTIVMANLGYFQFKANPGYYRIALQAGRSADIYAIESVGSKGMAPVPGDEGTDVALMDFQGTTLYPRLVRKPGMEKEAILQEEDGAEAGAASGGGGAQAYLSKGLKFAESLLGKGGGGGGGGERAAVARTTPQADINIFSVASGHLYERMLNIMMVSVMQHTNHTVKFWFIEQFLSPSFKDFIPTLAAAYGFEYEMVTYKWPHWLRPQKEKQREIWGYKILFLDVLFPLSLDKVIFVDADQIVRADLYELVQLDLQGAPYGFTPMCDSRTEMEGFRFWKQGYWSSYLRGLPYHISALYVVDLRRFRAIAAGDRLRQTYHTLSADPQSLANLDQDLPNHMQFSLPIFSLPQDWLWCETWCSDAALATAKTIDLCNNPLTKEPKLDRARRQVPEWTVYDDEIAALDRRRRGGGGGDPILGGDASEQQKPLRGGGGGGGDDDGETPAAHETHETHETRERDEL